MFRVILAMGPSIYAGPVIGDQLCNISSSYTILNKGLLSKRGGVIHVENAYVHFGY